MILFPNSSRSGAFLIGSIVAIVFVMPGLLSPGAEVQVGFLVGLIGTIILNGLIWVGIFGRIGLHRVNLAGALKNK